MALSQMKRQRARLPSERQSSSSAEVWWISSATIVSRPVMRSSSNQRRAMPVVTITTFHVGVSGVASRSRFTTPTRSGACRIDSAMGRMPRVFPIPVPATMPKPFPAGPFPQLLAMFPFEKGLDVSAQPTRWSRRRREWGQ